MGKGSCRTGLPLLSNSLRPFSQPLTSDHDDSMKTKLVMLNTMLATLAILLGLARCCHSDLDPANEDQND